MKKIKIEDTTVMGIVGSGNSVALAIFLKDTIELEMSLSSAINMHEYLGMAIKNAKSRRSIG